LFVRCKFFEALNPDLRTMFPRLWLGQNEE
jgi:hypothetical protein